MNTSRLLDQLLKAGGSLMNGQAGGANQNAGQNSNQGVAGLSGLLSGKTGAALGGGAIGLLLGNKKLRKAGGKVAVYGGLAALGVLAYKAYGNWQQQQQQGNAAPLPSPQTVDRLPAPEVEVHSRAVLRALIAAAKADGHVDDRERELIDAEVLRLSDDLQMQQWFDTELRKPLDPAEVARAATTPELAAEMYLASLLLVDDQSFMEKAYLQELARQLRLDAALVTELERQAAAALAG